MRRLILAGLVATLMFCVSAASASASNGGATAQAAPTRSGDVCADRLCLRYKPGVRDCRKLFTRYTRVAQCYINRAAIHYRQSRSLARYIAHRESRYRWWVVNAYGYAGLYQFGMRLWSTTPYRRYSRLQPRYAALAAMRVWSQGGYRHWSL